MEKWVSEVILWSWLKSSQLSWSLTPQWFIYQDDRWRWPLSRTPQPPRLHPRPVQTAVWDRFLLGDSGSDLLLPLCRGGLHSPICRSDLNQRIKIRTFWIFLLISTHHVVVWLLIHPSWKWVSSSTFNIFTVKTLRSTFFTVQLYNLQHTMHLSVYHVPWWR